MSILDLLRADGSIVVNKRLSRDLGLNEAVILSEVISLYLYHAGRNELVDGTWFYATIDKIEENTTLKRSVQDKAIEKLSGLGLIRKEMKGLPAKRHFTIDEDKIAEMFVSSKHAEKRQPDNDADSEPQNTDKARSNQVAEKRQPSPSGIDKQDGRPATTSNTNLYNTDLQKQEGEEESSSARERFARYSLTFDEMIKRNGSLSYKDEEYLEECLAAGWDARTAYRIYMRVRDDLDVHHFDAIHMTFAALQEAYAEGREILNPVAWFEETFKSKHVAANLLENARRNKLRDEQ